VKIVSTKAAITAATRIVENAVAGGDDATLASHFLFHVADGSVTVLASNGKRLLASAPVTGATVEGDAGSFTVSAWRFSQLLNLSPEGPCTLDFDGSSTKVQIDGRTIRFASLDPASFPYWDKVLGEAKVTATIKAGVLFGALSYIKPFVSNLDTRQPALSATECRDGTMWATDSQSLATATVPGLKDCGIRIHYADIPPVNAFLGLDADADIIVREHPTTIFFVRSDGGVFGVSRWVHEFPKLKLDSTTRASFTLTTENLRYAIRFLSVASAKDDDKLRFDFRDGKVVLSVAAVAGGREEFEADTKAIVGVESMSEIGRSSFDVNSNHVTAILNTVTDETVTFGVNWTAKNGYILYRHAVDGGEYVGIVVWRK
jgi:DNA polymerase III sliding clamp (beta) subunit (PCNA family)